jgi:hypothetical protein
VGAERTDSLRRRLLALGQVLRLGSHRMEVPISALLVLTLGGTPGIARTRVLETLIGAGSVWW